MESSDGESWKVAKKREHYLPEQKTERNKPKRGNLVLFMEASTQKGSDQHYFCWIAIQKYFMMRRRGQILSSWNQCNIDVSLGKIDKSFGSLFNQLKRIVLKNFYIIELVKLWCINWHCSYSIKPNQS